jgi:hypothetical protein
VFSICNSFIHMTPVFPKSMRRVIRSLLGRQWGAFAACWPVHMAPSLAAGVAAGRAGPLSCVGCMIDKQQQTAWDVPAGDCRALEGWVAE